MGDGRQIAIKAKWAGEGWPDDVRRAARDLPADWPKNVVIVARHLSRGAIEWLRERDANWADETGQARIIGPGGLIVIREPAPRETDKRPRAFSWPPSALAIAEVLLARRDRPRWAAPLAQESGWSTAQTAHVLSTFDAQGWTSKRGPARGPRAYRELLDLDSLLAAWSGALADRPREARMAHRATRDVMALLRGELSSALKQSHVTWAVSGWAGLELAAPFVTATPSLHIYVAEQDFAGPLSRAIGACGLREVDEGGRITFWRSDPHLFRLVEPSRDHPVVSSPRLYADLSSFGARGQDAADHVKAELIDPLHPGSRSHQEVNVAEEQR
jgi:hypothetical protein